MCSSDLEAAEGTVVPDWMGERVRGALFGLLKTHDADLATTTHADRQVQPYTVAWLGPRGEIRPGMRGTLRWTALDASVAHAVVGRVLPAIGDTIDSDAVLVGGQATIYYTTGSAGQNNHGLDFGFTQPLSGNAGIVNSSQIGRAHV